MKPVWILAIAAAALFPLCAIVGCGGSADPASTTTPTEGPATPPPGGTPQESELHWEVEVTEGTLAAAPDALRGLPGIFQTRPGDSDTTMWIARSDESLTWQRVAGYLSENGIEIRRK
jgi:hypothetical protein